MIDRFKWCVCCVIALIIQLILPPIDTNATDLMQAGIDQPGSTLLRVVKSAAREMVAPGEFVSYDLTAANTSPHQVATGVRVMDVLPAGFKFKKGSARFNGNTASDPTISADGRALSFAVGDLAPGASSTIRFEVEISAGSTLGKVVNVALALSSGGGTSNVSKATVTVRDELLRTKTTLIETSAIPHETLQSPLVNGSGLTATALGSGAIASQAAVAASQAAAEKVAAEKAFAEKAFAEMAAAEKAAEDKAAAEMPTLANLIGMSDISVMADVDGQFVKNMAENQILKNEFAALVGETNLLDSIRAGRGFNRDSLAALARTEQAKAQTGQAFALLLPSVSVHANSGSETSSPSVALDDTGNPKSTDTHSRTDLSLTIRQPLFDLPSFMDWRRRKVVEQARGENYRVSDGDAYISAVNAYLSLVSSRLQTDMTREFENQLNELLIYVEKRAKAGAASNSDMARVRARSQATLSSRLEQESAHAAAGIEFIRLTNLVPHKVRLPDLEDVGAAALPKTFDMAVTKAMNANPEIAALTAELQAATIDQSSAKGRFLPRLDAEYTDTFSLHAGGSTSSSGQRDKRLMMVLNWSLFSGGSDYKTYVERSERYKELLYRLDDQRRRVVQTLSANYATLATTRERIAFGYQELKSISSAAEAMSKRMLSGNQSLLDLLDVYDRSYQVRSRLVSLHILEMSTVTQLVRLTRGTPESGSKVKTEPAVSGLLKSTPAPMAKDEPATFEAAKEVKR